MKQSLRGEFNDCGCSAAWHDIYDLDVSTADYILDDCARRAAAIERADDASGGEVAFCNMVNSWE